jgi:Arc/MetJ-type ribon-helix-helix transcriptional regulator
VRGEQNLSSAERDGAWDLAKIHTISYFEVMTTTLNISLSRDQAAWVKSRKEEGGFASASDVIRDLIRRERDKALARLEAEFDKMDKQDGANGPAPVEEIVSRVKKIRTELIKRHETRRRP